MSRRVRLTLGVAGSACLVLALLPYYSHTAGPAAHSGVTVIELLGLGTLPLEQSKTVLSVGLPFSPLFRLPEGDHLRVSIGGRTNLGDRRRGQGPFHWQNWVHT